MSLGKVYLASGWFSPAWLEEVENIIEEQLKSARIENYIEEQLKEENS